MSFFPGEKLRYAETHFKFKLPWSLLYRTWPEVIFDSPFQFIKNEKVVLWMVIRDADRFPITIRDVCLRLTPDEKNPECHNTSIANGDQLHANANSGPQEFHLEQTFNREFHEPFAFAPIDLGRIPAGTYLVDIRFTAERSGKLKTFHRWTLPGLSPKPLKIQVLGQELPKPAGFVCGEMHCHTHYSADHVEYGASPAVLQQAAKALGLDFVSCTDHAYDFAFTAEDYTREAESPVPRFAALVQEVASLPTVGMPLMLAGEEVSAGNSKSENVHMTVMAPECYLPGLGDCGRYWLENHPTRKISQILDSTRAHCFAAHPFQPMSLLEKFIFRRGTWKPEDLNIGGEHAKHSIRGIQFWNGMRDEGFSLGRDFWIRELGKGHFLLPIGGNDAHGDLNDTTAVSTPLFSLKYSRDHVFGKVRTVVKLPDDSRGLTPETLYQAFDGDNSYITDGPALWWERPQDIRIPTESTDPHSILFHARSNAEMGGGFRFIRIYGRRRLPNGLACDHEEILNESRIATAESVDISVFASPFVYLRAEAETASGRFALTSAVKISV